MSGMLSEQRLDELLVRLPQTSSGAAPALGQMLSGAKGRRGKLRRKKMLRNLGSTIALLLAGLLATLAFTLLPRGNGWAVTDGWIVEYEIEVPAYYGFDIIGRGVQGVETPQSRLEKLVQDWSAEHSGAAPSAGIELATLNVGQPSPQSGKGDSKQANYFVHRATAQLTFMSDDTALLDELLDLLRNPGADLPPLLGEARKYSKTWITREKFPELYEPAVLWINGKQYRYPEDFTEKRDLDTFVTVLSRSSQQAAMRPEGRASMLYFNLFSAETRARTGLGILSRLDYTERGLEISSVDDKGKFDGLDIQPAEAYWAIQMGETYDSKGKPKDDGFTLDDYRLVLLNQLKEASSAHESEFVTLEVWQLKYLLFPASRFAPGQAAQAYAVSSDDIQMALEKSARYKATFDDWANQKPDYVQKRGSPGHSVWLKAAAGGELLGPFERGKPYFEQPMWCFDATLTALSDAEREELKAALDAVDPGATSFVWRLPDQKVPKEDAESVAIQ